MDFEETGALLDDALQVLLAKAVAGDVAGTLPDWVTIAVSATAACRRCERSDHDGLTANSDQSAHVQLGGLIEFARSTRV